MPSRYLASAGTPVKLLFFIHAEGPTHLVHGSILLLLLLMVDVGQSLQQDIPCLKPLLLLPELLQLFSLLCKLMCCILGLCLHHVTQLTPTAK